jgi:hypothetical protein
MPMDELLEISNIESTEIAEPLKKRIIEAFNLFMKTVKAKLVYPASSRLPQQFKEELFAKITSLCDEFDTISFKVEADRILYEELEVYRAPSKADNFAHVFFRDGILNFQIKKGIYIKELETFIDIISRMLRAASVDDDLATLLWESGFEHISYKLMDDVFNIDTFEYGIDSLKSTGQSKVDLHGIYENEISLDITAEDFEIPSEEKKKKARSSPYVDAAGSVSEFIRKAASYDEAEKAAMAELLITDAQFDFRIYTINLLFEVLGLETDNAGYHESLELFAKVRDDFIRAGDFKSALTILTRVKEMEQAFRNLKDLKLDKIQGFIESFASSEKIKVIINTLNQIKDLDYDEVLAYLKLLPWQATAPLVMGLGELAHFAARRVVCKALVVLGADKIDLIAKGIEDPRWYVVRNVVSVLGQINNARAMGYFRRTIKHPDIRVRKETLVSAAKVGGDEAFDFLIVALSDEDEKLQILALRELVLHKVFRAYSQIEKIVTDKEFKDRSTDQIKEFLEAMAQLGGEKAFVLLKKMVTQFAIMASEKQKRLKNYAIRALSFVQSPEAAPLLEKLSRSRDRALADTARRALHRRSKGGE